MEPEVGIEAGDAGLPTEPVVENTPTEVSTPSEMFTVKVDGQDIEVSRDELLQGYSRHSDYTRKTQALAADREKFSQYEALAAALDRDPVATLDALRNAYGLNEAPAEPLDPEEARIAQLEKWVADAQERERQVALDRQVQTLSDRYGDVDEVALLEHAIKNNIPNLEAAYRDMQFEKYYEQARAVEKKTADEAARTDAKRGAQVVAGGANRQAGSTSAGEAGQKLSMAEAWELAKQQTGFTF